MTTWVPAKFNTMKYDLKGHIRKLLSYSRGCVIFSTFIFSPFYITTLANYLSISIYLLFFLSIKTIKFYIYLSIKFSIYLSNKLSIYLSIFISIYLSFYISTHTEFAPLGQTLFMAPEGEGLSHICSSPAKLYTQLLHGSRMLWSRFQGPGSSLYVASLLKGDRITAITNDDLAGS